MATPADAPQRLSYWQIFAIPRLGRLLVSTLCARIATQAAELVLVLFVLQRFQSPTLAGVTIFFAIAPGLLVSPIAGALLDRHYRLRLIGIDYAVAALSMGLLGGLALVNMLSQLGFILIVTLSSLTNSLSTAGTRSLLPVIVPRQLWDRVNGIDSGGFVIATLAGPGLAGGVVAVAGGPEGLLMIAALYVVAGAMLFKMREPMAPRAVEAPVLTEARRGLSYVLHNRTLRGLAVTLAIFNAGFGVVIVALPVRVLGQLHGNASAVGLMWVMLGVGGLVSSMIWGRMNSEGHEHWLMCGGALACVGAVIGLMLANSIQVVAVSMLVIGLANGPYDIGLFALRQRAIAPEWLGRAFAVSMALNFAGTPIGSAMGGPIAGWSTSVALGVAATIMALSIVATLLMLRPVKLSRAIIEAPSS